MIREIIVSGSTVQVRRDGQRVSATVAPKVVGVVAITGPRGQPGPPGQGLFIWGELPQGTKNNANVVFSLENTIKPGSTALYRNGLRQLLNLHYHEQAPNLVVIDDPPNPDDDISIDYEVGT